MYFNSRKLTILHLPQPLATTVMLFLEKEYAFCFYKLRADLECDLVCDHCL